MCCRPPFVKPWSEGDRGSPVFAPGGHLETIRPHSWLTFSPTKLATQTLSSPSMATPQAPSMLGARNWPLTLPSGPSQVTLLSARLATQRLPAESIAMPCGERMPLTSKGPVGRPSGAILVRVPGVLASSAPLFTQALPRRSIAIVNGLYSPPPETTRALRGSPLGYTVTLLPPWLAIQTLSSWSTAMPCGACRSPAVNPVSRESARPPAVNREAALPPWKSGLFHSLGSSPTKLLSQTRSRRSIAIPHHTPWIPPPLTAPPLRGWPAGSSEIA